MTNRLAAPYGRNKGKTWKVVGYCDGVPYWFGESRSRWRAFLIARRAMKLHNPVTLEAI